MSDPGFRATKDVDRRNDRYVVTKTVNGWPDAGAVFGNRCSLDRQQLRLRHSVRGDYRVGTDWSFVPLFGYVAARHQYRHDHRDVSDGLPHPTRAEQGRAGDSDEIERARRRDRWCQQSADRCRGSFRGRARGLAQFLRQARAYGEARPEHPQVALHRGGPATPYAKTQGDEREAPLDLVFGDRLDQRARRGWLRDSRRNVGLRDDADHTPLV